MKSSLRSSSIDSLIKVIRVNPTNTDMTITRTSFTSLVNHFVSVLRIRMPRYSETSIWIWREYNLLVLLLPHKVALDYRVRKQIVVPIYLLVYLADIKQTTLDAISKGFFFCKRKLPYDFIKF